MVTNISSSIRVWYQLDWLKKQNDELAFKAVGVRDNLARAKLSNWADRWLVNAATGIYLSNELA